ncbi:hypothetical protein [Alicyclobacillus fodiniaquatilis]|uniref:PrgI family protein n=1 Tax=Alicyclobacillus fodiniaquatilis TaxID=1661150 RepID=A0ABW4JG46_9BACL
MEEGFIEVNNQGMRLFGGITTKHILSVTIGVSVFAPLAIVLYLAIRLSVTPAHPYLPYVGAGLGFIPGAILGAIPVPRRKITLLILLYRKTKFRMRTQVFTFDREYRQRVNRERYAKLRSLVESEVVANHE